MKITSGRPEVIIGLIDGPVLIDHPNLEGENIREIAGTIRAKCVRDESIACAHGTFVAGILFAKRQSTAPGICPGCTLLVRPIFPEATLGREPIPNAIPEDLAAAVIECVDSGARLLNLSVSLMQSPSAKDKLRLTQALDYAAMRGVIVVAAAGNQGNVGSTVVTGHPWVIPVIACDRRGTPLGESNLGHSIGRRGLSAPGEGVTGVGTSRDAFPAGGTSVATPFVTGTIALVWSEFPDVGATQVLSAVSQAHARRPSIVPPRLNAGAIHRAMAV